MEFSSVNASNHFCFIEVFLMLCAQIGLPAKSGVSGCTMVVVPNVMGFCLWSPPLDVYGNSVRGVKFCEVRMLSFLSFSASSIFFYAWREKCSWSLHRKCKPSRRIWVLPRHTKGMGPYKIRLRARLPLCMICKDRTPTTVLYMKKTPFGYLDR